MESPLPLRSWVNHQSWVSSVPSYLAGVGDVTAAAALTANYIVVGDDGVKGVKAGAGAGATINFGSGAAENQTLSFVSNGGTGVITWVDAAAAWLFSSSVAFGGSLTANAGLGVSGNITVSGTVDGVDVAADAAALATHIADATDPHTAAVSFGTSLTTPLAYGSTAAAGALTLAGSSHGTPAQDAVNINVEGACFASFKDHSASNLTMMLLGSDTLPTNIGDAMFTATRDGTWNAFRIAAHSATAAHHPTLSFARSYGTGASPTDVGDGANIGSLAFKPYGNSAAYYTRAQILAVTSGAPSGTTIPVDLLVSVGSTGVSEVCRFTSDQALRMAGTNEIQFYNVAQAIWAPSTLTLHIKSATQTNFQISSSTEMSLAENTLRLYTGGDDIYFVFDANGTCKWKSGANERIQIGTAGIGFNGSANVAQSAGWAITNWTSDKGFDCLDAAADVDHECRQVVATLISYLIERGDLAGTVTGP